MSSQQKRGERFNKAMEQFKHGIAKVDTIGAALDFATMSVIADFEGESIKQDEGFCRFRMGSLLSGGAPSRT
jgi:hypothetical protein